MDLVDVMHAYFRGEKYTGIVLIPVGLVALGFVVHLWRCHSGGFMWAMVIPLALAGCGLIGGGAFLAIKTDKQVEQLDQQFRASPAEMVADERARMDKVNANWPRLKTAWTVLIAVSLVLLMAVRKDWVTGLSLAFLILGTTIMTTDVFAERRAEIYTDGLKQFSDRVSDQAGGADAGTDAPATR